MRVSGHLLGELSGFIQNNATLAPLIHTPKPLSSLPLRPGCAGGIKGAVGLMRAWPLIIARFYADLQDRLEILNE